MVVYFGPEVEKSIEEISGSQGEYYASGRP